MTIDLVRSILSGDHSAVSKALRGGADPNTADEEATSLCHAAYDGNLRIVRKLLEAGADVDLADSAGFLPLHLAASRNHAKVVTALVEAGASIDLPGKEDGTALHVAAAEGADKSAKALLSAGINPDALDTHGAPALHYAAMHGRRKVIKLFVSEQLPLDSQDGSGRTALLHALDGMQRHLVAEWEMAGTKNGRACTFRVENGEFTCQLSGDDFKAGVPLAVERKLSSEHCPPHRTYLGCRDVAGDLLKAGADFQIADQSGRTALHRVCELGEAKLFNKLTKLGADPIARDSDGCTPLHEVSYCDRVSFLERAKLARHDFSVTDNNGNTPIHHLAISGSLALAKAFRRVSKGPYSVVNSANKYPSTLAREAGHDELADYLQSKETAERNALFDKKSWKVKEVIAKLEAGTHFVHALPYEFPDRETAMRVHCLNNKRWVTAYVNSDTGQPLPEKLTLKPSGALEEAIRSREEKGRVDISMLPNTMLPEGSIDRISALVAAQLSALEPVEAGTHWLVASEHGRIAKHDRAGWLYVGMSGTQPTRCKSCEEDRAIRCLDSPEAGPEPIPADSLVFITSSASQFAEDLATFENGQKMLATRGSGGRRETFAEFNSTVIRFLFDYGLLKEARFNGNPRSRALETLWLKASEPSAGQFEKFPKHTIETVDMVRRAANGDYQTLIDWVARGRVELGGYRHSDFNWFEMTGTEGVALLDGKAVTVKSLKQTLGTKGKLGLLTFP